MKLTRRSFSFLVLNFFLVTPLILLAGQQSSQLVDWSSDQGIQRVSDSKFKVDFFPLANNFQTQANGILCGPTTASIVLNALRLSKKDKRLPYRSSKASDSKYIPDGFDIRVRMYSHDNFIGSLTEKVKTRSQIFGEPIDGKQDFGLQIRQLHKMFLAHGAVSRLRVVNDNISLDKMRSEIVANLQSKDDYVVINYARKLVGQNGPGHISPIGAYHETSDSFLVMDVTSYDHNWVWVPANTLYKALKSFDTVENRGYLLIHDS
jgi:hypothetical protein